MRILYTVDILKCKQLFSLCLKMELFLVGFPGNVLIREPECTVFWPFQCEGRPRFVTPLMLYFGDDDLLVSILIFLYTLLH